jgi:hypothetical protein
MQTMTTTIEAPQLSDIYMLPEAQKEIFASTEQQLSVRQISHYVGKTQFRETGYNTTTFGSIGFTRVEPEVQVTDDILLQARLDILCDKLRAKY